jgi:hypothetical protein
MKRVNTIGELQIGEFIKLTQTNGPTVDRLNLSGEIVNICKETGRLEIKTIDYIVGVGWKMEGYDLEVFKLDQKPKGWGSAKAEKPPEARSAPIKTKKDRVIELVNNNPRKKPKALLAMAKKEVGGDESILASYVNLALHRLNRLNPVK